MAQERAIPPERFRVVRGRPAETAILDLADGVRLYLDLLDQSRQLEVVLGDLRGRILRAMERIGVDELTVDGVQAIRQLRHFAPELDEAAARRILERVGRLAEAERRVLDPAKAAQILDELFVQGRISRAELPYTPPRVVEALIVRRTDEATA